MRQRFAPWDQARAPVHLYINYTVGGIVKLDPGFRAGRFTLQVLVGYFSLFLMSDFKGGAIGHLHLRLSGQKRTSVHGYIPVAMCPNAYFPSTLKCKYYENSFFASRIVLVYDNVLFHE